MNKKTNIKSETIQAIESLNLPANQSVEEYISILENKYGHNYAKWNIPISQIHKIKKSFATYSEELQDEIKSYANYLEELYRALKPYVTKCVHTQLSLVYGLIPDLIKNLKLVIATGTVKELKSLLKQYEKYEEQLIEEKGKGFGNQYNLAYNDYIDFFDNAVVLLTYRLSQMNILKNEYSKEDREEALLYIYDTYDLSFAYDSYNAGMLSLSEINANSNIKDALVWIDDSYIQIPKMSINEYGQSCIIIENLDYKKVQLEYDHILISPYEVIIIAVITIPGKYNIDSNGNWTLQKYKPNGSYSEEIGFKNPLQRLRQQEKLLASFLPSSIPIGCLICLGNEQSVIHGTNNRKCPVVKYDMLVEYLENIHCTSDKLLSNEQICKCKNLILSHMCRKMLEPDRMKQEEGKGNGN